MRQKHVPLGNKSSPPNVKEGARKGVRKKLGGGQEGVKIVYPSSKSVSKTCTLRQKVGFEASKTCTLRQKVGQKRVPSARKWAPRGGA